MQNRKISNGFRAMNTDVLVTIAAEFGREAEAAAAIQSVKTWFDRVEATLSRFKSESDLSQLNAAAGQPYTTGPMLREVLRLALSFAAETDGLFDPTVLPALIAAGYDRSFEQLPAARDDMPSAEPRHASWQDVQIDDTAGTVCIPEGCAVDLGGIGKGWTVDQAAERLSAFTNFAVDAGGDMCVRGRQADGSPWTVGIQDPFTPERNLTVLNVRDAAVATSTIARRQWTRGGQMQHHIIDPRTGRPAALGVVAVTVLSRSAARSEVLSKTALVMGPDEGQALLQAQEGADGLMVLDDGRLLSSTDAFGSPRR
jgi:thiamine biosynthesis lipoprotein